MKLTPYQIKKGVRYLRNFGVREFVIRLMEKGEPKSITYEQYRRTYRLTKKEFAEQRTGSGRWKNPPLITCIFLEEDLSEQRRSACARKLQQQSYTNWELVLAKNISEGIGQAKGTYFVFVESGDSLAPQALYEIARGICNPQKLRQSGMHWKKCEGKPDVIYTDEDCAGSEGLFKPDYDPEWLAQDCYIRHLCCIRTELALKHAGSGLSPEKLIAACAADTIPEKILHIPKILYHAQKSYILHMTGEPEKSEPVLKDRPLISIIIPNRDECDTLKRCMDAVEKSSYSDYEVIVVENGSTQTELFDYYARLAAQNPQIKIVTWEGNGSFNYSAINNYGVSFAKGSYLVFLNNDVEMLTQNWLESMLLQCRKEDVAACGVRLCYPDDTIQHAGIMVAIGGHARGVASNMCVGLPHDAMGYMGRIQRRQSMSAVTAACMMMRRDVFEAVGGFTEELAVAFNDVDLCLKARRQGYRIVYEPAVEAYHYESKSRGQEDTGEKVRRFQQEIEYMRRTWNEIMREGDPYYNPNLTGYRSDYSLKAPGRRLGRGKRTDPDQG